PPVISPLSLHDALPIFQTKTPMGGFVRHMLMSTTTALELDPELYDLYLASGAYGGNAEAVLRSLLRTQTSTGLLHTSAPGWRRTDRKSTRLNSSHVKIS